MWEGEVRAALAAILSRVVGQLEGEPSSLQPVENLFVLALAGRRANAYARLERLIVTMVGREAARLVAPFFTCIEPVEKPFDFRGVLRGREYTVKVVLSDQVFNSTLQRRVAEASPAHANPVVLTIQGDYFKPRRLGAAKWYSAHATWVLLTGERGAYAKFRSILFEVAEPYRRRVEALLAREAAGQRGTEIAGRSRAGDGLGG